MTTQEKIEAIRAKCIKANPEIVELKFGCKINIRGDVNATFTHMDNEFIYWLDTDGSQCDEDTILLKDLNLEIIGRPVRLIYWAFIRFWAHATSYQEGGTFSPDEMNWSKAIELWERKYGKK